MEQADDKRCPKSEAGEQHERHGWLDKDGQHSCDGDILSADDVFALLGMRRVIPGDVPMYDTMPVGHILPKAEAINLLFGEPQNSLKNLKLNTEDLFQGGFEPVEIQEKTGPLYSPNDPLLAFQQSHMFDTIPDGMIGVKTEFAQRTYGWSEQQLREALFEKEQEAIELKLIISKFGDRIERIVTKMLGKVDKINAR